MSKGKIVFLDEPTEGLDKEGRKSIYKIIEEFRKEDKTIVIATNDQEIIDTSNLLIDLDSKPKPIVVKQKNEK